MEPRNKEEKEVKRYVVMGYECYCDYNNIHIVDSYKVKNVDEFLAELIKTIGDDFKYKRNIRAWSAEWYAHNLAYKLGIMRSHSKDVDLNDDEYTFAKILYQLGKPFAKLICR